MPIAPAVPTDLDFERLLGMCKVSWRPVLGLLAKEGDYSTIDFRRLSRGAMPFPDFEVDPPGPHRGADLWYPTRDHVISIHDEMIAEFGGSLGSVNLGAVDSAIDRIRYSQVFGNDIFPTLTAKAGLLMHSILTYHPFADGQKRTGLSSAFVFLGMNGFSFWSRDVLEDIQVAVDCAAGKLDAGEITRWIAHRAIPLEEVLFIVPWNIVSRRALRNLKCPRCGQRLWKSYVHAHCRYCHTHYRIGLKRGVVYRSYPHDGETRTSKTGPTKTLSVDYEVTCVKLSGAGLKQTKGQVRKLRAVDKRIRENLKRSGMTVGKLRYAMLSSRSGMPRKSPP